MNYDRLIKNWHAKASEEDYFSKFVFEYLAFIAFLRRKKFPNAINDRSAIQRLKGDHGTRDLYFQAIDRKRLKGDWERIQEELENARLGNVSGKTVEVEEIRWWNCSHNNLHQMTTDENNKIRGVIHGLEDWENMVEFWYSIRNNLFHGGKNPEDTRDRLLVRHGYKTLRPLVEIFLANEE